MGKRDAMERGAGKKKKSKHPHRAWAPSSEAEWGEALHTGRGVVQLDLKDLPVEHENEAVLADAKSKKKKKRKETLIAEAAHEDAALSVPAKSKKKRKARDEAETKDEMQVNVVAPISTESKKPKKHHAPVVEDAQDVKKERPVIDNSLRLFVGGISKTIDEATLRKDFEECGEVANVKLLLDGQTWESRGIAFVTFKDEAGVKAALEYDGEDYGGRKLSVKRAEAKGSGKGSGSGPGPKPPGCNSVVLKRLSPDVTEDDLRDLFRSTNPLRVGLLLDKSTGQSRCTARLDFQDGSGVDEAMKLFGGSLKGRPLSMDYCKPRQW